MKAYTLNKVGYEPFIDFLKGLCILWVICEHCMPLPAYVLFGYWGKMAVPVFLIIQSFHMYKKNNLALPGITNLYKRILQPFLITTLFTGISKL